MGYRSAICVCDHRHCEPTGRRKAPPADRLREAIHSFAATRSWIASSQVRLAMTVIANAYRASIPHVLYDWNGSRSDQHCVRTRRTDRDRRSLPPARPLLRTVHDRGDVGACARGLMPRQRFDLFRAHPRFSCSRKFFYRAYAHVPTDHAVRQDLERSSGSRS